MKTTFQYKNLSKSEQAAFDEYLPGKLDQIETLLSSFDEDTTVLEARIEKFNKHDAFDVEFLLVIPLKTFTAKEASHSITKAVDLAKDRLVAQLKKFRTQLKTDQTSARTHLSIRQPQIHESVARNIFEDEMLEI